MPSVTSPTLWYGFIVLFSLAGILNLVRGLRRHDHKRTVNIGLGIAGFCWAAAAALFWFAGPIAAYIAAGVAFLVMLSAAVFTANRPHRE